MAVYYDEYGDYDPYASAFDPQEFVYDSDTFYADNLASAEYYEPYDNHSYMDITQNAFHGDDLCTPNRYGYEYEEIEVVDAGTMQIAYGEPGYWEEYHRRRYEIIYGSELGENEEELPETSDEEEHRAGEFSGAVDPYDAPDVSGDYASAEMAELEGVEDEVAAWEATWECGPPIGENELEWAVTMDAWRQRIEAGADIDEESGADAVSAYAPKADRGLVHVPTFECTEAPLDVVTVPPMLEELQAAYDRGEIPEADREECARLLGELWACELEDQRLIAAGYIWNEELGDYVHATETDLPEEYEREEDDGTSADRVVDGACDVHHLVEAALPSAIPAVPQTHVPRRYIQSRSVSKSSRSSFPPTASRFIKRRSFPLPRTLALPRRQPFASKSRPTALKTQRRRHRAAVPSPRSMPRELLPHIETLISHPAAENADAMVPAPSATPPPVVAESRCSPATGPIVVADILAHREPVPPDLLQPEPSETVLMLAPSKASTPDTVLIPRQPKPPNIHVDAPATPSGPPRTSVLDSVVLAAVPKPPDIHLVTVGRLKDLSESAQRRRNAQRRIAKKGKG